MADIDPATLNSLAEKIDGLDLTDAEQSVLDQLLERAAAYEPEVEGFAMPTSYTGLQSGADLSKSAFSFGRGLGLVGGGGGMKMEFEARGKLPGS